LLLLRLALRLLANFKIVFQLLSVGISPLSGSADSSTEY
jgi:hypothetical protein